MAKIHRFLPLVLLCASGASPGVADEGTLNLKGPFPVRCQFDYSSLTVGPTVIALECGEGARTPLTADLLAEAIRQRGMQLSVRGETFVIGGKTGEAFALLPPPDPNSAPQTNNNAVVNSKAGDPAKEIDLVGLGYITDADPGDSLTLIADGLEPQAGNVGTATVSANKLVYTPPASLSSSRTDVFSYQVTDGRVSEPVQGKVSILVASNQLTCSSAVAGPNCFEDLNGNWYTTAQELALGAQGAPVFQGLNPNTDFFRLGVFSNPTTTAETHWGCGSEDLRPGRRWKYQGTDPDERCTAGSLKERTYAVRYLVDDGYLKVPQINVMPQPAGDMHRKWIYALADRPYDLSSPAPAGTKTCEYRTPRDGIRFAVANCPWLAELDANTWPGRRYLYLMMKPAGTGPTGKPASACGTANYLCRTYISAWGNPVGL